MALAIQNLTCKSPKVLHVTLNIDRPDNWISEHQTQITPMIIAEIIETAIESGWKSNEGGAAYEFKHQVIKHT